MNRLIEAQKHAWETREQRREANVRDRFLGRFNAADKVIVYNVTVDEVAEFVTYCFEERIWCQVETGTVETPDVLGVACGADSDDE